MRTLALLALLSAAAPVRAQDAEIVIVPEADGAALDLSRVEARVRAETGAVVRVGPVAEGTAIVVRVEGDARAVVVLVRADGTSMERTAEVPTDPAERAEIVAILAVNMLHDESAELLALLTPPPEPEPPVVIVAPAGPVVVPVAAPVPEAEPVVVTAEAETPVEPGDPFLRLGLSGHFTTVPRGRGIDADWFAGFELAWTPLPWLAAGVRDLSGGGSAQGDAWHGDASPFFELGLPIEFLTLHADVGVHLQVITSEDGATGAGAAPFLLVGARFRVVREFSIGLETTLRGVATDTFLAGLASMPQGAMVWSAGLSFLFHVS